MLKAGKIKIQKKKKKKKKEMGANFFQYLPYSKLAILRPINSASFFFQAKNGTQVTEIERQPQNSFCGHPERQ